MFERLDDVVMRYEDITRELEDPQVVSDQKRFRQLMKEQSDIAPLVETYGSYKHALSAVDGLLELIGSEEDSELKELARLELSEEKKNAEKLEQDLKKLLLPKDPNDDKNVIIEIRAGAGGDEAALFAGEIYRMYVKYADSHRWKTDLIDFEEIGIGGMKSVSFIISGKGAWSRLKYESGVHRVQRVPETESQGRIQTSTVTVAVLPEAEEVDVTVNPQDLEIDTHRASGAGGQHINKTDSAIRILHKPTGIVVECQDERSQLKNREKAMKVLRSKILRLEEEKRDSAISAARREQVGTGDRSERIRTYNYQQGRVSDHRIGLTLHSLDSVLNGRLDELIDALVAADRMKKLESGDFR